MIDVRGFVHRLEIYAAEAAAPVQRCGLPRHVSGCADRQRILISTELSPASQFLVLVHELTHVLVHLPQVPQPDRTMCEYEAEAVELLMADLVGIESTPRLEGGLIERARPTDELTAVSVRRVSQAVSALSRVLLERPGELPT